jgi:hypothetical protein
MTGTRTHQRCGVLPCRRDLRQLQRMRKHTAAAKPCQQCAEPRAALAPSCGAVVAGAGPAAAEGHRACHALRCAGLERRSARVERALQRWRQRLQHVRLRGHCCRRLVRKHLQEGGLLWRQRVVGARQKGCGSRRTRTARRVWGRAGLQQGPGCHLSWSSDMHRRAHIEAHAHPPAARRARCPGPRSPAARAPPPRARACQTAPRGTARTRRRLMPGRRRQTPPSRRRRRRLRARRSRRPAGQTQTP